MNQLDKYTEFLKITIEHEYFNGLVPVDLYVGDPSVEKKYGIRIRRNQNCWILYGRELQKEDFIAEFKKLNLKFNPIIEKPADKRKRIEEELKKAPIEEPPISFNLILKSQTALFYYVTSFVKDPADTEVPVFDQKGITTPIEDITLRFITSSKYFEYIFFMKKLESYSEGKTKEDESKNEIKIICSDKKIVFETPQIMLWENGQKVMRFRSEEKIELRRKDKPRFTLIEKSDYGERILLSELKAPSPQSISVHAPDAAITAFYTV